MIKEISGRGLKIRVTMDTNEVILLMVNTQRTSNTFYSLDTVRVDIGAAVQAPNPYVFVVNNILGEGIRNSLRHASFS